MKELDKFLNGIEKGRACVHLPRGFRCGYDRNTERLIAIIRAQQDSLERYIPLFEVRDKILAMLKEEEEVK